MVPFLLPRTRPDNNPAIARLRCEISALSDIRLPPPCVQINEQQWYSPSKSFPTPGGRPRPSWSNRPLTSRPHHLPGPSWPETSHFDPTCPVLAPDLNTHGHTMEAQAGRRRTNAQIGEGTYMLHDTTTLPTKPVDDGAKVVPRVQPAHVAAELCPKHGDVETAPYRGQQGPGGRRAVARERVVVLEGHTCQHTGTFADSMEGCVFPQQEQCLGVVAHSQCSLTR